MTINEFQNRITNDVELNKSSLPKMSLAKITIASIIMQHSENTPLEFQPKLDFIATEQSDKKLCLGIKISNCDSLELPNFVINITAEINNMLNSGIIFDSHLTSMPTTIPDEEELKEKGFLEMEYMKRFSLGSTERRLGNRDLFCLALMSAVVDNLILLWPGREEMKYLELKINYAALTAREK